MTFFIRATTDLLRRGLKNKSYPSKSSFKWSSVDQGLLPSAFTWNVYRIVKLTFDAAKIGINSESSKFWSDFFHLEANFFGVT